MLRIIGKTLSALMFLWTVGVPVAEADSVSECVARFESVLDSFGNYSARGIMARCRREESRRGAADPEFPACATWLSEEFHFHMQSAAGWCSTPDVLSIYKHSRERYSDCVEAHTENGFPDADFRNRESLAPTVCADSINLSAFEHPDYFPCIEAKSKVKYFTWEMNRSEKIHSVVERNSAAFTCARDPTGWLQKFRLAKRLKRIRDLRHAGVSESGIEAAIGAVVIQSAFEDLQAARSPEERKHARRRALKAVTAGIRVPDSAFRAPKSTGTGAL